LFFGGYFVNYTLGVPAKKGTRLSKKLKHLLDCMDNRKKEKTARKLFSEPEKYSD